MNEFQGDGSASTSSSSSGMTSSGNSSRRGGGGSESLSPSAYAMSASVERSAECVLAVLSTSSLTTSSIPNYSRSISSPTGCTGSSSGIPGSSSPTTSHSSQCRSHENCTCINKSPSPTPSLRSCPGAMGRTSQLQGREHKSSDSSSLNIADGDLRHGSNKSSPNNSQDEEEEYFCDEGGLSFSEDRSATDSIPDSFHTPSASIQNLSVSVNNNYTNKPPFQEGSGGSASIANFQNGSKSTGSKNGDSSGANQHQPSSSSPPISSKAKERASVRSNKSNKSGSGSDSGNNGSDRVPAPHDSANSNANNSAIASNPSTVSGSNSSGSNGKGNDNAMTSSGNKSDKETSPKAKRNGSEKSSGAPSIKGSPELPHSTKTKNGNGQQDLSSPTNVSTPPEILQSSVESSASSKESFHTTSSSSKEIYNSPYYGPIKPNKKKMWYHVFTPSYKTRSNDFKKIFKELPPEERLIVDYSCALQKEILIQGRMYVSQNFISFYANIFGWETQTSIRLKDVTSITKEKTALVIPNAVQVSTDSERFFFTSFVTRDSTYVMLFKLWQSSLLEEVRNTIPTKEIWKLVHSCYGDELGVASEEDAEEFLACAPGALVNAPSVSTLISTSDPEDNKSLGESDSQVCASELGAVVSLPLATVVSASGESGSILLPEPGSLAASPVTDLSDSSDSEGDVGPVVVSPGGALAADDDLIEIPICPVSHQVGRMVVDSIIPTDVDNLFTMLFTKSKFFQDLHASRKTFDILQSDWHKSPDGSQNVRQVSFTVTLNHVMGPKHSQVTETQVMLPVSKPGVMYAIDTESVNAGIPYADSFYVTTHFCLTRHSASDTKLCIINQIKYRKSVFSLTKGFIEKNTWAGLEEFYTSLERALKEECTKVNASITAPPTPASGRSGPTRRPNGRKKYPAPSIPSCPSPLIRPPVSALKDVSVNGSGRALMGASTHSSGSQTHAESSLVLKIILGILTCLLLLNAFLYVKLTRFESAKSQLLFSAPSVAFPKNIPQSNQEWVTLLQQQEELHRLELQKWHEMLISALKTLHQAEEDLESLKFHITSYNTGRQNLNALKEAVDELHQSSLKHNNVFYQSQGSDEKEGFTKDGGSSTNEQSGLEPTGSDYLNGDKSEEPSLSRQKSFGNEL